MGEKRPSVLLICVAIWTAINTAGYFMIWVPLRIFTSRADQLATFGWEWSGPIGDFYVPFLWLVFAALRVAVALEKANG